MTTRRALSILLVISTVVLAASIGSQFVGPARAQSSAQAGKTIPYTGSLTDEAGQPVADGAYDFVFTLYDVKTDGAPLWTETQESVAVQGGGFAVLLGSVSPLPKEILDGRGLWLEVAVRGPGEAEFTPLSPRQELLPSVQAMQANSVSPAALSCAHTHLYENWVGSNLDYALRVENTSTGDGIRARAQATAADYAALWAYNVGGGTGAYGGSTAGNGVWGKSDSGDGVRGESAGANKSGVYGLNTVQEGYGGYFRNTGNGVALFVQGGGGGRDLAAFRANNSQTTNGMAAYLTNNSNYHNAHFSNAGAGGVLYLQNGGTDANGTGGGDFITAVNKPENDAQFRVLSSGEARSDVGFNTPAADFSEMLPAVEGVGPGDVLVIAPDGKLARSTEPYQATVVGVYSTQPGFVGGHPVDGPIPGTIPLAIVGVVPVKVTAENGAIRPGDLLVASSTPGHAMRAGANPPQGTVIGKALEGLDAGTGTIRMLVTLQ